jgi:tRNA U34 5-methylaminomethyl-2-thiouridine-forming methyltransferase MnmC
MPAVVFPAFPFDFLLDDFFDALFFLDFDEPELEELLQLWVEQELEELLLRL